MTNAWIQRFLLLGNFAFWWGWAYSMGSDKPVQALVCAAIPILIMPLILGTQCVTAAWYSRLNPDLGATAPASFAQWWHAWLQECRFCVRVIFLWQPFRHRAIEDQLQPSPGRRGIVLVHGFFCNRAFWTHWMRRLQREGRVFVAVDLEALDESIDDYAKVVERAVASVEKATGLAPVIVGHSMGGLAIRAWAASLLNDQAIARIHHIFTLGTPHHGTALARFTMTTKAQQMSRGSAWLGANALRLPNGFTKKCTCFYSHCDNIVFPAGTATLPGADNRHVVGRAHIELAFTPEIEHACFAAMN
jgi:triacylglycerol lipase